MAHALTETTLMRDIFCHNVSSFVPYTSAMAGNMQARARASLHTDLQSEIHWEMRDCLFAVCFSPSAPLSAGLPLLASDLTKLCFGELFGKEVLVCNSGKLLLRWRGRSGLEARGMRGLGRAWPSHRLPCRPINLPSVIALCTPPERLLWCPYRYSRGSELPNMRLVSSSFSSPCCI